MAADVCEAREAGESAGAAHKSGASTSEQSCARVKKKARTSETTAASRVSQPDSLIALLMHKVEEMDQYDAAANAREVSHSRAMSALVFVPATVGGEGL